MSDHDEQMEAGSSRAEPLEKRKIVDAVDETTEVPDPKRARIRINTEQKTKVLHAIAACLLRTTRALMDTIDPEMLSNMPLIENVLSLVNTAHNILRQEANGTGNLKAWKEHVAEVNVFGEIRRIRMDGVMEIVRDVFLMFDLRYTPPKNRETDHWWGTAAPFLTFLAAHKLRRNELRVGHSKMPISKGKDPKFVNVSGWGLDTAHHILLEGISYPPDKKSAMAQSLGPMTIAIQCARIGGDQRYGTKWHMAMKKAFAHVPEIDSIISGHVRPRAI